MSEGAGAAAGDAERIRAEALGEPGSRRFRLIAVIEGDTRIVWMEKEQLRRLGEALRQVLEQLPDRGFEAGPGSQAGEYDLGTASQFRAGRMELGYDEDRDRLIIIAHDLDAMEEERPSFACRISRTQAQELSDEAEILVSAGRPLCPLCGRPIGPGPHVCAQQNGHHPEHLEALAEELEMDEDEDVDDEEEPGPGGL